MNKQRRVFFVLSAYNGNHRLAYTLSSQAMLALLLRKNEYTREDQAVVQGRK